MAERKVLFLIGAEIKDFQKAMNAVTRDLSRIGKQAENLGRQLTKTITLPLAGIGLAAGKAAVDFESAFTGVQKVIKATAPELQMLHDGIIDLSLSMPLAATEIAKVAQSAGQLGIETKSIIGFTKTMVMLGDATNLTADDAATALARIANVLQLPQDQFDRMGSVIVELGNNFATTERDILEFAKRIAGAGKIAGFSASDIFAIGTAMSSVGIEAESGGTSVQKVLIAMNTAVATSSEKLTTFAKTAGMSASRFAQLWKDDAASAFAQFVEGIGREGDMATTVLGELGLSNERVIRAFLSLGNAGDTLTRALSMGNKAWEENIALTQEAELRYSEAKSRIAIAKNSIIELSRSFGADFLPTIKLVADEISRVARAIINMSVESKKRIVELGIQIGLIPLKIYAVGKAISFTALAVKGAVSAVMALRGAFIALRAVIAGTAAITFPLVAVYATVIATFAAVVIAGQYLVDNWSKISLGLSNILTSIGIAFTKMARTSIQAVKDLIEFIINDANLVGFISKMLGFDMGEAFTNMLNMDEVISKLDEDIKETEKILGESIERYKNMEWGSIGDAVSSALEKAKKSVMFGITSLLNASGLTDMIDEFKKLLDVSFDVDLGGEGLTLAQQRIAEFGKGIERAKLDVIDFNNSFDWSKAVIQIDNVKSKLDEFKDKFKEIGGDFKAFLAGEISTAILSFGEALGRSLSGTTNAFKTGFEQITLIILDFASSLARLAAGIGAVMLFIPGFQGVGAGLLAAATALQAITTGISLGIEKRATNRGNRQRESVIAPPSLGTRSPSFSSMQMQPQSIIASNQMATVNVYMDSRKVSTQLTELNTKRDR